MLTTTAMVIAQVVDAKQTTGPVDVPVTGVSIDSRTVKPGYLFVAFPGDKVDGHDYIAQAVANGAKAILISHTISTAVPEDVALIRVDDPLLAIQNLARWERSHFTGPVIAVTGSNGKTTTKEMLREVFASSGSCLATEKNFNNELGLPLTLLRHQTFHQFVVLEMGMRGPGEIRDLCEIARPTTGIITNIGHSHLELLGSQEQIALAKTELLDALPSAGSAILHGNDKWLRKLVHRAHCRVLWFGLTPDCDAYATEIYSEGFKTFFSAHILGETITVTLPTLGTHNVLNALAALLAGAANGLSLQTMVEGLQQMSSTSGRLHRVEGRFGRTILDDCYNASPSSMEASLQVLMEMAGRRPTVAILGDMYELGSYEETGHREVGEAVTRLGVTQLIAVGKLGRFIAEAAQQAAAQRDGIATAGGGQVQYFQDKDRLLSELHQIIPQNAVVLVKASRGMRLEDVVKALA